MSERFINFDNIFISIFLIKIKDPEVINNINEIIIKAKKSIINVIIKMESLFIR